MAPTPFDNMRDYLKLENMLNPPAKGFREAEISTTDNQEVTRYTINIVSGDITTSTFPNTINSRFINHFDFPTINEDYRGKAYCYTYGVSAYAYSRTALVKKNVCNSEEDKVWYTENHYMSEMHFLPSPGATAEDEGTLITIGFDGPREQSYLLLLDAKTFTPINQAYLPHNIPWSAHGMYFPEANFPVELVDTQQEKENKLVDTLEKKEIKVMDTQEKTENKLADTQEKKENKLVDTDEEKEIKVMDTQEKK